MVDWIVSTVVSVICTLISYVILLPVCMVVATPFVLILAPFRRGGVKAGYAAVYRWWDKWGMFIVP